jgi:hypothetical protein
MGFDYGGNGALYYAMLENTNFDPSVLAIASFHGELVLVAVETATLTTDLASSSTGGGGNDSGEFDWSSMGGGGGVGTSGEEFDWTTMTDGDGSSGSDFFGSNSSTGGGGNETGEFDWSSGMAAGELSGEEFDWTTMTTGGGDDGSGTNNNNNSTRNRKVISLDIDEALIAAEKGYSTSTSYSKPQILIFSGVEGDDMTNVLVVEKTLIGMNANYEILRFAHTSGSFTTWGSTSYNHHASIRSMVQWKSILSEIFPPLFDISSPPPSVTEPSIDDDSSKSTLTCGTSILVGSVIFALWTVITALM